MTRDVRTFDIVVDGVRLSAVRIPAPGGRERPVLVFLHDSLGSVGTWREFPERLAQAVGLGALAYDRRGHGASEPFGPHPRTNDYLHDEARALGRVLDAAGVDEAVLFGHSDGASIALLAAALDPARVRAVVSEAGHVFVEDRTLEGIRSAQGTLVSGDLLARVAKHHGAKAEALVSAWAGTWLSPGFRSWNIERELRRVRCPVLVLQGELDEYGTDAQVRAIARGVAGPARVVLLPGLRHTPHREAPDVVLGIAAEFLAGALSAS